MESSDFTWIMARVKALSPQEKAALREALGMPVTQALAEKKREHAEEYIAKMNAIIGGDVRSKKRRREFFYGRAIIAHQLRNENYSYQEIGQHLGGRNHATIINACGLVADALEYPNMYYDLIHILNKFKQAIND